MKFSPTLPSQPFFENKGHFVQLIFLLLFVLGGIILSSVFAYFLGTLIWGADIVKNPTANYYRFAQIFSALGAFFVPAVLFAFCHDKKWFSYSHANQRIGSVHTALCILLLAFLLLPVTSLAVFLNQQIHLPESLAAVERWMEATEKANNAVLETLLSEPGTLPLVLNVLVCALLPALCEEFLFRGTLQQLFHRWFGNAHVAIWAAAIIFSAIHFQFSGFFARMLLGAYLGYLFYWSGSLWLPVLAHLLHNALSIIMESVARACDLPLDGDFNVAQQLPASLFCVAAVTGLLALVYKQCKEVRKEL